MNDITSYMLEQAKKILSIDSPTGFTAHAAEYVLGAYKKLGYDAKLTNKGGIFVCVNDGPDQADEPVESKADTEALGIMTGDIVCFDPRTTVTESGYIKSRFLDDKLSVGILLGFAKYLKETAKKPARKIYQHITVFEEVGHGGSASIPADVAEILAVDMGCVGDGLSCKETQVSICAKDSGGPYHYDVVSALIEAARTAKVDFAVDVYPHYGSDAEAGLRSGIDCRHGLIGSGVYASHGYERSHVKGMENTFRLLKAYLNQDYHA